MHLPWARLGIEILVLNGIGLLFTHRLRAYIRAHNWRSYGLRRLVPRIVVASLLLALPLGLVSPLTSVSSLQSSESLIQQVAPNIQLHFGPLIRVVHQWANWTTLFALWLALYFVALSIRRRRDAELRQSELTRSLQQAELRLLKAQLNPHFLFNALNTVRSLIADNPQVAQVIVTRFANTLRYALNAGQHEIVPLSKELEVVRDYLEIESLRLEDRLSVDYSVSDEAAAVGIPAMLLQTLVENAIKHGIAELPRGGRVRVDAVVRDGMLLLEVVNSRPAGVVRAAAGTGLRNSAERLRLIFGPGAGISLDLSQPDLATATVRIPVGK
ncbi:MAG TPA: histidine kinase [Steroidobacteraceae bacterium]|nr:histidine kinase [Steroidobacteraceae bacterium]